MNCRELAELLFEFVSGELAPERCALLEEHLKRCPPCHVYLETYRLTIHISGRLPCRSLPADCEERLRAVVEPFFQNQQPDC
jgi:anti-sigma factor RsiW